MTDEPANFQNVLKSIQAVDQSTGLPLLRTGTRPIVAILGWKSVVMGSGFIKVHQLVAKNWLSFFPPFCAMMKMASIMW